MWSKLISRIFPNSTDAGPTPGQPAGVPSTATEISNPLSSVITPELINQYQGGASSPRLMDPATEAILGKFQHEYFGRISQLYRPLVTALLNFNFILVDDEGPVRTETRLGLSSLRLNESGASPADNIIGEYGDAPSVLKSCLPFLDPQKKYLFILDGSFPPGPQRDGERLMGCQVVLEAIEQLNNPNVSVLIRSGETGSEIFAAKVAHYPFVLGLLHKAGQSCLFQWALATKPLVVNRIIEKGMS